MARLFAVALILWSAAAVAAGNDDDVELAKSHFHAGIVYFDRGDYRRALTEFKSAEESSPRPELDFNIGRTYERLGDAAHAWRYYARYLAARPSADDSGETREAMARLERRIGTLKLTAAEGLRLTLDEEPIAATEAETPATEGPHVVRALRDGKVVRTLPVEVMAGQTQTLRVDEPPPPEPPTVAATPTPAPPAIVAPPPAPSPMTDRPRKRRALALGLGLGLGGAVVVGAAILIVWATTRGSTDYYSVAQQGCPGCMTIRLQ